MKISLQKNSRLYRIVRAAINFATAPGAFARSFYPLSYRNFGIVMLVNFLLTLPLYLYLIASEYVTYSSEYYLQVLRFNLTTWVIFWLIILIGNVFIWLLLRGRNYVLEIKYILLNQLAVASTLFVIGRGYPLMILILDYFGVAERSFNLFIGSVDILSFFGLISFVMAIIGSWHLIELLSLRVKLGERMRLLTFSFYCYLLWITLVF